jgi:hypothetical protein
MAAWLSTVAGAALIVVALRDIFHSVVRPAGEGELSQRIMRSGWWLLRRGRRRRWSGLAFGGPALMLLVLGSWAVMLTVGWALIYWPRLSGFHPATGLPEQATRGLGTALYLSAVTLSTCGLGDLAPVGTAVRVMMPTEAFVGFGLVTATLSWILELYPVIARKRALARQVSLLAELEERHGCPLWALSPEVSEAELSSATTALVDVTGQLLQMPASYYFEPRDARHSLAAQMPRLLACARRAQAAEAPATCRVRGELVQAALDDLAHTLRTRFLPDAGEDLDSLFVAFRDEHQADEPSGPRSEASP